MDNPLQEFLEDTGGLGFGLVISGGDFPMDGDVRFAGGRLDFRTFPTAEAAMRSICGRHYRWISVYAGAEDLLVDYVLTRLRSPGGHEMYFNGELADAQWWDARMARRKLEV